MSNEKQWELLGRAMWLLLGYFNSKGIPVSGVARPGCYVRLDGAIELRIELTDDVRFDELHEAGEPEAANEPPACYGKLRVRVENNGFMRTDAPVWQLCLDTYMDPDDGPGCLYRGVVSRSPEVLLDAVNELLCEADELREK